MYKTFFTISRFSLQKGRIFPEFIAGIAIWSVVLPLAVLQAWVWVYQEIYFGLYEIPKLRLKNFVTFDRSALKGLTAGQKMACAYCAYSTGTAAWLKEVINRTEVYSCAIKHSVAKEGQEHQKDFFGYDVFNR